jgi:uncharacterized protein (DUF3820 family)
MYVPVDYRFCGRAHIENGEVVLDFGRHSGEPLSCVPTGYLKWFMRCEDFPPDLVDEVKDELESRCSRDQDSDFGRWAHTEDGMVILDFGKHYGLALSDVPTDYLAWITRTPFPASLISEVEDELERRPEW